MRNEVTLSFFMRDVFVLYDRLKMAHEKPGLQPEILTTRNGIEEVSMSLLCDVCLILMPLL